MVYKILRVIVRWCLKIYFKKIYLVGSENFEKDQPYFIACNHPAGFIEPLLLACFLERDLHFLVRGDLFYNPVLKPLLIATNQIPIFRIRDGFSNLKKNKRTIATVAEKLSNDEAIVIFIEGSTKLVKRLRPLQKGMARMTFSSMEEIEDLNPKVLPVGMSFTDLNAFREEVLIKIGTPIEVRDYLETYKSKNVKGIKSLTRDTFNAMKICMVNVKEEREEIYEPVSQMWRTSLELPYSPIMIKDESRVQNEIDIANQLNEMPEVQALELKIKAEDWLEEFKTIKSRSNILTALPAFFGYIFNYLPANIGVWFANRNVVNMAFYSPIRMVVAMVSFIFYYIIIIVVCAMIGITYLAIPLIGVVSGIVYLYFTYNRFESKKRNIPDQLKVQRNSILREYNLI